MGGGAQTTGMSHAGLSFSLLAQGMVSSTYVNLSGSASVSYSVEWVEDLPLHLQVVRIYNTEALRT